MLDDLVFEACVIGLVLCIQWDYVEGVVPEEMFLGYVLFEFYFAFFELFAGDVADVARVWFVALEVVVLLAQAPECIQHDTRDNIPEQQAKENRIDRIIDKPLHLKHLHRLPNRPRDIERHKTAHHTITKLLTSLQDLLLLIDILRIVAERDGAEHDDEDDTHEGDEGDGHESFGDCFEDVCEQGGLAEDVDYVDEEECGVDECAVEGYADEEQQSVEV